MIFFEESDEEINYDEVRIERRNLRDKSNPFDLPDTIFQNNFRLGKEGFKMILENTNIPVGSRTTSIPPVLQLACTLNFLSCGSYQFNIGSNLLISMAQTTVSKVIRRTLFILEDKLCDEWIKMNEIKFATSKTFFYEKFKLPGVIGCVDGTHVPVLKPKEDEHIYFNRKGFHSLNVQICCDHDTKIIGVNPRYGGAAHDSSVWMSSNERGYLEKRYEDGDVSCRMLGDSGYPLEPWMLTPYRSATDRSAEMKFNEIHSRARSIVERTIGIYKGRWRCLSDDRRLRYPPVIAARIVNVCAALHNICLFYKMQFNDEEHITQNPTQTTNHHPQASTMILRRAEIIRNNIRDSI